MSYELIKPENLATKIQETIEDMNDNYERIKQHSSNALTYFESRWQQLMSFNEHYSKLSPKQIIEIRDRLAIENDCLLNLIDRIKTEEFTRFISYSKK